MIVLEAVDLAKEYRGGDGGIITVLDGVTLQVARGEMVADRRLVRRRQEHAPASARRARQADARLRADQWRTA